MLATAGTSGTVRHTAECCHAPPLAVGIPVLPNRPEVVCRYPEEAASAACSLKHAQSSLFCACSYRFQSFLRDPRRIVLSLRWKWLTVCQDGKPDRCCVAPTTCGGDTGLGTGWQTGGSGAGQSEYQSHIRARFHGQDSQQHLVEVAMQRREAEELRGQTTVKARKAANGGCTSKRSRTTKTPNSIWCKWRCSVGRPRNSDGQTALERRKAVAHPSAVARTKLTTASGSGGDAASGSRRTATVEQRQIGARRQKTIAHPSAVARTKLTTASGGWGDVVSGSGSFPIPLGCQAAQSNTRRGGRCFRNQT